MVGVPCLVYVSGLVGAAAAAGQLPPGHPVPHPHRRVGGVAGLDVDPHRRPMAPGLKALRSYSTKHGTEAVPAETIHRCYPLGRWVTARRARGCSPPTRTAPGRRTRTPTTSRHRRHRGQLHPRGVGHEPAQGIPPRRPLPQPRRRLEAIDGWEWNPHDAAWRRMFTHLEQAAHHHGSVAHITQTTVIDGANIGH